MWHNHELPHSTLISFSFHLISFSWMMTNHLISIYGVVGNSYISSCGTIMRNVVTQSVSHLKLQFDHHCLGNHCCSCLCNCTATYIITILGSQSGEIIINGTVWPRHGLVNALCGAKWSHWVESLEVWFPSYPIRKYCGKVICSHLFTTNDRKFKSK